MLKRESTSWRKLVRYTKRRCRSKSASLPSRGYQEKVVSSLSVIKTQNDKILSILTHKKIGALKSIYKFPKTGATLKSIYKFPLETSEEMEATEELLKNTENYNNLVSYLETLGGVDTSQKVARILKTLLADRLASAFNFYGKRSQKRPFCHLVLRNCVVEAIKNSTSGVTTDKEIEDSIKIWLKHAPQRLLKKKK